ncbi:hypothetical protein CLOSTMETH_02785 [[Clostridium] methylpentosum DSM 5476]|uniref:Uncharacterized protein n=1 Tax=[Clostridium] methylpentosum DSM 5476 TaxID=537013 RepID=C0EFZ3_9FIRM|nr:hypothetical protein CLOSTMETH_02785 [[Clostridium] methylpentosum DSM 5476]
MIQSGVIDCEADFETVQRKRRTNTSVFGAFLTLKWPKSDRKICAEPSGAIDSAIA